jgi:hypothetical protein
MMTCRWLANILLMRMMRVKRMEVVIFMPLYHYFDQLPRGRPVDHSAESVLRQKQINERHCRGAAAVEPHSVTSTSRR